MKKAIPLFLLLLVAAFYVVGVRALHVRATQSVVHHPPTPTVTTVPPPFPTCIVTTGIAGGTVNLRECQGAACGAVLDILTEGASLDIITAGEWMNVTTDSGVTGWLNKKYCEVRP